MYNIFLCTISSMYIFCTFAPEIFPNKFESQPKNYMKSDVASLQNLRQLIDA